MKIETRDEGPWTRVTAMIDFLTGDMPYVRAVVEHVNSGVRVEVPKYVANRGKVDVVVHRSSLEKSPKDCSTILVNFLLKKDLEEMLKQIKVIVRGARAEITRHVEDLREFRKRLEAVQAITGAGSSDGEEKTEEPREERVCNGFAVVEINSQGEPTTTHSKSYSEDIEVISDLDTAVKRCDELRDAAGGVWGVFKCKVMFGDEISG
jgi:hypothetical protein